MTYKIKNLCTGKLNLPDLKMEPKEEKTVNELTANLKDYKSRKYISITIED